MIRDIRRGRALDSIEITAHYGDVRHVTVDGFTADERRRHREEMLQWLTGSGIPLVSDEGRRL